MKKQIVIVSIIVAVLTITIFITLHLTQESREAQKQLLINAEIILKNEQTEIILNKKSLGDLKEEYFEAVLDTSSSEPKKHSYTGVQLKNILLHFNIDLKDSSSVILSGADGFSVAYSKSEVLKDKNVYIAYMEDDKYLGSYEDGGRGPYESIVLSDVFSNRRCKWITRIEVK